MLQIIAVLMIGFAGFQPAAGAKAPAASTLSAAVVRSPATHDGPPPVPHPVETEAYYQYCTRCHGFGKMKPYPQSHAGFTSKDCTGCHRTGAAQEIKGSAVSGSMDGKPARIPHAVDEDSFRDCRKCHGTGKSKALPATHAGIAIANCLACHQVSPRPKPAVSGSAEKAADLKPARIPHATEGSVYRDCTQCHALGKLKPFPANHAKYPAASCTGCHQPGSGSPSP
jgi:hypothetical protein